MSDARRRDNRDNRDSNDRRGGRPMRRRSRRKVCQFCVDKVEHIDYKDVGKLRKFLSEKGKILPRRISGNCAKHQRQMTTAIKRARHIALLPYTTDKNLQPIDDIYRLYFNPHTLNILAALRLVRTLPYTFVCNTRFCLKKRHTCEHFIKCYFIGTPLKYRFIPRLFVFFSPLG